MLGYRADREDWDYLLGNSSAFPASCKASGDVPDNFHPKLITKNQWQTNSCVGYGLSTLYAALNLLLTGEEVNYSAWFAYLAAQRESWYLDRGQTVNMFGSDDGATLAGAMKAASTVGVCRDELYPFPGRYVTSVPKAATDEAAQHCVIQYAKLTGYDEIWRFLSSNQGPVLIGTQWREGQAMLGREGVESRSTALVGSSLGYHCRCVIGWSTRRDSQGRRYLRCKNSHSIDWGNQGESEIEPDLFDVWAQDRFAAFFGASESRPYEPRPVAWVDHPFVFV
jgi:hypothetical protein